MSLNIPSILKRTLSILLVTLFFCANALATVTAYVNCSTLSVYKKASTSSAKLGTLKKGTKLGVVAMSGNWAKVTLNGKTGYAAVKYLAKASSSSKTRVKGYTTRSVTVYKKASTSSSKSATLPAGSTIYVVGESGSFYKVENSAGTATGYIYKKYLSKTKPATKSPSTTTRTAGYATKDVAVYKKASTSSSKLCTVSKGTKVYVIGESGSFYKVQNASGSATGYIYKSYLSKSKPSSSGSSNPSGSSKPLSGSTKAEKVVNLAKSLVGSEYKPTAKGPSTFDCSGFTYYCYGQVGISLKRSSKEQGNNNGTKISKISDLKAGDLVFFDTNPNNADEVNHVGIYIGGGKFVHASSSAGKVITSSLSSGFYHDAFYWGRRVF